MVGVVLSLLGPKRVPRETVVAMAGISAPTLCDALRSLVCWRVQGGAWASGWGERTYVSIYGLLDHQKVVSSTKHKNTSAPSFTYVFKVPLHQARGDR